MRGSVTRFFMEMIDVTMVLVAIISLFGLICSFTVPVSNFLRVIAVAVTAMSFGPLAMRRGLKALRYAALLGAVALLGILFVFGNTEATPNLPPNSAIVMLPGETPPNALMSLIDERDITLLGARVLPWLGGILPREAEGLIEDIESAYQGMRWNGQQISTMLVPSLLDMGTSGSYGVVSFRPDAASPVSSTGEQRAALIFLHGFGGNWGLLCWRVAGIAASVGATTFCPSLNINGLWGSDEGKKRVDETVRLVKARGFKKIILAGLSNGAVGAAEIALERQQEAGIDAVLLLFGAHPSMGNLTLPVLAIYGSTDQRFPPKFIEWCAKSNGASQRETARAHSQLELRKVKGTHMTLLGNLDETGDAMSGWLSRIIDSPPAITDSSRTDSTVGKPAGEATATLPITAPPQSR